MSPQTPLRSPRAAALAAACLLGMGGCATPRGDGPAAAHARYGAIAAEFAARMPAMHLTRRALDGEVAARAMRLFAAALDAEGGIFLPGDVAALEARAAERPAMLRDGDLSLVVEAVDLFRRRQQAAEPADPAWAFEQFLSALAHAFDPHSDVTFPGDDARDDRGDSLSACGIGALVTPDRGAARIVELVPGGPADRDGRIRPGDRIVAVGQGEGPAEPVLYWPLSRTMGLVRGRPGTRVALWIAPAEAAPGGASVRIELVRAAVRFDGLGARGAVHRVAQPDGGARVLGQIVLRRFYSDGGGRRAARSSARDVAAILDDLRARGVDGVVLDLRGNAGGVLAEAAALAGLFAVHGPIGWLHRGEDGGPATPVRCATPAAAPYDGPLLVLVDRTTASGAEALAAALQDRGRAVVAGDSRTFGKGTLQEYAWLGRGARGRALLKATTGCLHRLTGAGLQLEGVRADVPIPSLTDDASLGEASLPYPIRCERRTPDQPEAGASRVEPATLSHDLAERSRARFAADPDRRAWSELVTAHRAGQAAGSFARDIVLEEAVLILADMTAPPAGRGPVHLTRPAGQSEPQR